MDSGEKEKMSLYHCKLTNKIWSSDLFVLLHRRSTKQRHQTLCANVNLGDSGISDIASSEAPIGAQ